MASLRTDQRGKGGSRGASDEAATQLARDGDGGTRMVTVGVILQSRLPEAPVTVHSMSEGTLRIVQCGNTG